MRVRTAMELLTGTRSLDSLILLIRTVTLTRSSLTRTKNIRELREKMTGTMDTGTSLPMVEKSRSMTRPRTSLLLMRLSIGGLTGDWPRQLLHGHYSMDRKGVTRTERTALRTRSIGPFGAGQRLSLNPRLPLVLLGIPERRTSTVVE